VNDLLPIGRFSRLCRLTVKALRHYDELGLLRPAYVDPDSGYRYYGVAQAAEAERIRVLRSLELPLHEIQAVLRERDTQAVRARLQSHGERIRERIEEQNRALAYLQKLIQEDDMSYDIQLRELPDLNVISLREKVEHADISCFMGRAMRKLYGHMGIRLARPAGSPFSMYHDEEWCDGGMDMEVCLPTSRLLRGKEPVRAQSLAGRRAASTVHPGPYDQIGQVYRALAAWMQEQGYQPAGPPREVYLVGPGKGREPADYRTEVLWPVKTLEG